MRAGGAIKLLNVPTEHGGFAIRARGQNIISLR